MYITCANSFHILRARSIHPTCTNTVLRICTSNTYLLVPVTCTKYIHNMYIVFTEKFVCVFRFTITLTVDQQSVPSTILY